jgi:hypothetical protein
MKKKTIKPPAAAFPDRNIVPGDDDLKATLGRAFAPLAKVTGWLRSVQPDVAIDERFPAQSGWHRIYLLKKRRLFYLVPKRGDFRFSMVLGDKAIAQLKQGGFAARIQLLLKDAKRYPEGTAFIFDRKSFDPEIVIALLEAKIAR